MQSTSAVRFSPTTRLDELMINPCNFILHQLFALRTDSSQNEHNEQLFFESTSNSQSTKAYQNAVSLDKNDLTILVLVILTIYANLKVT